MYWVGYVNSGKGINDWGSWSTLSDKEWRTNCKYDTALYEVDINTGLATMLSKVQNRWTFSALWIDGDDVSDGAGQTAVKDVKKMTTAEGCYNLSGQSLVCQPKHAGIYVVRAGGKTRKVIVK
jgi:hypothetical protein